MNVRPRLILVRCLLSLGAVSPVLLPAKSAKDGAESFVAPSAFQLAKVQEEHGIALISQRVVREWRDPFGTRLGLGVDDTNVISPALLSSQFASIVEQATKSYPLEKIELAHIFNVKGHDWIVLRLRGSKGDQKHLRIVAVGEFRGFLVQIELVGPEPNASDIGRYLKWILEDNSPANPAANASQPAPTIIPKPAAEKALTPEDAIHLAAAAAPDGVDGIFELTVRATGRDNDVIYLNSENNYRDQRCLTIQIPTVVVTEYVRKFGLAPDVALKGKHIRVNGEARRATIWITQYGLKTQNYYYQTHVKLVDPRQIEVVPADDALSLETTRKP
ncbi:MAG: hypothetical protein PSW75_12675 [bacterium]|nr:hypothetical protein [bacterium]MDI1336365.1 hypothetical protein [Lacunisphaera sp.]